MFHPLNFRSVCILSAGMALLTAISLPPRPAMKSRKEGMDRHSRILSIKSVDRSSGGAEEAEPSGSDLKLVINKTKADKKQLADYNPLTLPFLDSPVKEPR